MGSGPSKYQATLFHMAMKRSKLVDREALIHSRTYPPGLRDDTPMESAQIAVMDELTTLWDCRQDSCFISSM